MTITPLQGGDAVTMTSDQLLDLINEARDEAGEPPIRRNKLAEKIEDELAGEHYTKRVVQNLNNTESAVFDLTRDQCMLVSMRESKVVRRKVVAKLNALAAAAERRLPENLPDALRFAADLAEEKALLTLENQQQAKKIESLVHFFMPGETPPQFAKRLNGVNSQQITACLLDLGWIWNSERKPKKKPKYRTTYLAREKELLGERPRKIDGEDFESPMIRYELQLLEEGSKVLHDLYMAEKLPMKKTWDGQFFYEKFNPEKPL